MCQKNHTSDDFERLLTNLIDSSECYHDGRYLGRCYLSELLDAALAIAFTRNYEKNPNNETEKSEVSFNTK